MKRSTMLGGRYSVVAVISAMLLFSCSQLEDIHPDAIQDNQIEATADGFKLTPLGGINAANFRTHEDVSCDDYCINPDDASTFIVESYEASFQNKDKIFVKSYQKGEVMVYEFRSSQGDDLKKITFNGSDIYASNQAAAEPFIYEVALESVVACTEIKDDIEVRSTNSNSNVGAGGNTVVFSTSYALFDICVIDICEEFMVEAIEGMENAYRFTYISNEALEDVTIQMTLPQIADWEDLDGKSYEEFGNGANGGIRWTGDLAACGDGITFELQFKPACEVSNSNTKGNKNTTPSSVNLMTNFVVQGGEFGGNKLKNNITAACN
ncbi:hypothetical protein [Belliella pelovolcani]|uniref:hypothetical protein n=1 Tax=Belliella pelovolcani TaxID=529505 RepID=UPI003919F975